MIRNTKQLREFEDELVRRNDRDYFANLRIYEALYREGVSLGVFPLKDPLDGVEADIILAKRLNSV